MEYIIITLFGIFVGIALAGYMFTTEINKKEKAISNQKAMIKNRDILIERQLNELNSLKRYKKDILSILNLKSTIVDKYDKIKELFTDDNQVK